MILLIGDPRDPVVARVGAALKHRGARFARVDERAASSYAVRRTLAGGCPRWQVEGGGCQGTRPVGAMFVRHRSAPVRGSPAAAWRTLCRDIDLMLFATSGQVLNRPSSGMSHYSKPYHQMQLAAAGFQLPRTLVTQDPAAALRFILELRGRVVMKGVSCVKSTTRMFRLDDVHKLLALTRCPVLFQEFIAGDEFRVTVVADNAVATAITARGPGCPQDAAAVLPEEIVRRCIAFIRAQGLVVGGFDLRRSAEHGVHVLELNPFPLFTHHENGADPVISGLVAETLMRHHDVSDDVLA